MVEVNGRREETLAENSMIDLRLNSQEVQAASRVLTHLNQDNHLISSLTFRKIQRALETQLAFALKREVLEPPKTETIESRAKPAVSPEPKVVYIAKGRGFFGTIGRMISFGLMTFIGAGAAVITYQLTISPEAVEYRAAQERNEKEVLETSHVLGLDPSTFSKEGWRIRYAPKEEGVEYLRVYNSDNRTGLSNVEGGKNIKFPSDFPKSVTDGGDTGIAVEGYTRLDGKLVPLLKISLKSDKSSSTFYEKWILQEKATSSALIDNRAIVFENVNTGEVKHLDIAPTKSKPVSFEVALMQKTEKQD